VRDGPNFWEDESTRKQVVWALYYTTDLSQQEIAKVKFLDVSQPTVSRIINEYDPARDGFDPTNLTLGFGEDFEETTEDAREDYREAVAQLIAAAPNTTTIFRMIEGDMDFVFE
jgi:predicted transcriptional regulator